MEEVLTNLDFKAGLIALGITKLCLTMTTMLLDVSMSPMESMLIAISSDSTRSYLEDIPTPGLVLDYYFSKKVCSLSLKQTIQNEIKTGK